MIGKRNFTVYDPIFGQRVVVFVNGDARQFDRWQRKMNISNPGEWDHNFTAFSTHLMVEGEPNIYVIWLTHFDWTLDDQESLVHEIVHTITRIWEANNIEFGPATQEFFAHSVGKLYSTIGAKLHRPARRKAKSDA